MSYSVQNKIAIFIPNLGGGGAERVVCNLANCLVLRGYSIEILLMNDKFENKYHINSLVKIKFLNCSRAAFSVPYLIRYLKKNKPDIFLSVLTHANIVTLIAGAIIGYLEKIYISEHGVFDRRFEIGLKDKLVKMLAAKLYPFAKKIIAVSDVSKKSLEENLNINPAKVVKIYNPIVNLRPEAKSNKAIKDLLKNDINVPVVISAGRFCHEKDFITLLRAFQIVVKKMPARLVLLGDGPDRAKITDCVIELGLHANVEMPGFVDNLESWMACASVFVLSSPRESFGNVLVEAMSLNLPVISTDCGGPSEILENGFWGKLVPVGDFECMATQILNVLSSKNNIATKERAKDFSIAGQTTEYTNLFFN